MNNYDDHDDDSSEWILTTVETDSVQKKRVCDEKLCFPRAGVQEQTPENINTTAVSKPKDMSLVFVKRRGRYTFIGCIAYG